MTSSKPKKILIVAGARPNFMKIAPIIEALNKHNQSSSRSIHYLLVHTGQHYDQIMSDSFFRELNIPVPDRNLGVGSGTHSEQTAEIMKRFERVCLEESPTHILVVGDVNSTIACALVAAKLRVQVIHVEAGLRSFNRSMPEEINRILTDAISDHLFITEKSAEHNLLKEGIPKHKIHFVGNVMIDTLRKHQSKAQTSPVLHQLGLRPNGASQPATIDYGLVTAHRPSNVDDRHTFCGIIEALLEVSKHIPLVFPVHPRTRQMLVAWDLDQMLTLDLPTPLDRAGLYAIDPLGYLDFLCLMSHAKLVLTDSGGIQEETTVLGIPCVTMREDTERPVTITHGTNTLSGTKKENIIDAALTALQRGAVHGASQKTPPLWDGQAAERIVQTLSK